MVLYFEGELIKTHCFRLLFWRFFSLGFSILPSLLLWKTFIREVTKQERKTKSKTLGYTDRLGNKR